MSLVGSREALYIARAHTEKRAFSLKVKLLTPIISDSKKQEIIMKKIIITLLIFIFTTLNAENTNYDSIYTDNPFFNNIVKASALLYESRELLKQGKTIKSENKRNEAIKILDQTIYSNRVLTIDNRYKMIFSDNRLQSGSMHFEIVFDTKELYDIKFDFSFKIREIYDNFKNMEHLTKKTIGEQIEDAKSGDLIESKLKIVPACEYGISKTYYLDEKYGDRGVSYIITCRILEFKAITQP